MRGEPNITLTLAARLHKECGLHAAQLSVLLSEVLGMALAIADDAVRCDIECYAFRVPGADGEVYFDTTQVDHDQIAATDLAIVNRALQYIEMRGDVWPWVLKRHIEAPHLVRFEDKEPQP